MGLNYRLDRLERALPGPGKPHLVVLWVMFDGDVPDWAMAAVRSLFPDTPGGVTIVHWWQDADGSLVASWTYRAEKVAYKVTPDGCQPVEGTRVSDTGVNQWQ